MNVFNSNNIMVCVTQQRTCERLINKGSGLQKKLKGELFVIHVVKEGVNFLGNDKEGDALEYLFNISKGVGANLTVLRSQDIVGALAEFAQENSIEHIVLGEPPAECKSNNLCTMPECKDVGIISELKENLPNCQYHIMPYEELR
jgi:K+-sensing histidine kinase KdpD